MPIRLRIAFSENPLVRPLKGGAIKLDHIELDFVTFEYPGDLFYRNLLVDEFDVSEMGIPWTIRIMDLAGKKKWDWAKLPVFLSRGTGWSNLYVNSESGINTLADLRGKKICVPEYNMSMCMWLRVILRDQFRINPSEIVWYLGRSRDRSQGDALGVKEDYPAEVTVSWLPDNQTADRMLEQGKVDAAIIDPNALGEGSIDRYGGAALTGNPRIHKLLPDNGRALVDEFTRSSGVYQINHHVIVQNRILRQYPWVAMELYNALQRSRDIALGGMARQGSEQLSYGNGDYPLGVKAMRKSFDRYIQEMLDAELIKRWFQMEDVYYPTTLAT